MCINEYTNADDPDANKVQVPFVEGQSPADIVSEAMAQLGKG